ncbi:MAG TPA: AMP-binding protein [Thermoanaerobaculia bacterium]|nr:AMP-binding protein [Thermoanaerobaculia bacterium]
MEAETLVPLLERAVRRNFDLPAFSDFPGPTMTYGEVAGRVARFHAAFHELGVKPGAKVGLLGRNSSGWATAYLAILSYGAVAVPILPDFREEDIHHILNHSESALLLTTGAFLERLDPAKMPGVKAVVSTKDFTPIFVKREGMAAPLRKADEAARSIPVPRPEAISWARPDPEDLASIVYTSGTTGFSKGVMLPHRSLYRNVLFAQKHMPLEAGDALVSFLPLAHAFGCAFEFLFPVSVGCRIAFLDKTPSPQIILKAFGAEKPRLVLTVPLVLEKIYAKRVRPFLEKPVVKLLTKVPALRRKVDALLRKKLIDAFGGRVLEVVVGGAALNPVVEDFLLRIGFPVTVGYGMTECGPLLTYAGWREHKAQGVGRVVDGMELAVDSDDPSRTAGEVKVRGPHVMAGYYKSPEATREVLDENGWLKTGDLGLLDADGFLTLRGRSKTMFLGATGQNVYPEEIEARLNALPFVAESLVVERDHRLHALVYPDLEAADAAKVGHEAILKEMERNRQKLNDRLPPFCQVATIEIVPEEFQKTPTRKIKRFLYAGRAS